MSEQLEIEHLLKQIRAGKRKKLGIEKVWKKGSRFFRGQQRSDDTLHEKLSEAGRDATVNLEFSRIKALLPNLIFKSPKVLASARRKNSPKRLIDFADVSQEVLNYTFQEQNSKKQTKITVLEALLKNVGVVKIDWDAARRLPRITKIPIDNVVINEDATDDPESWRFIAVKIQMTFADLKADLNLKQDAVAKLLASGGTVKSTSSGKIDDPRKDTTFEERTFDLWEVWKRGEAPDVTFGMPEQLKEQIKKSVEGVPEEDRAAVIVTDKGEIAEARIPEDGEDPAKRAFSPFANRLVTFAEGFPFMLRDEVWPFAMDHDEFPFSFLKFNFDPDDVWAFPDFKILKPLQDTINFIGQFIMNRMQTSSTDKVLMDTSLSDLQKSQLMSGVDLEVIEADLTKDSDPIRVLQFPQIKPEMLTAFTLMKGLYDEISGVSEIIRGGPGVREITAKEAGIREERAQARISFMLDTVEDWLDDVVRKVYQVARFTMTKQDVANIVGPERAEFWIEDMKAEDIRREVLITIQHGSTQRRSREQNIREALGLFNTLFPIYLQTGRQDLIDKLIRRLVLAHEPQNPDEILPEEEDLQKLKPEMGGEMSKAQSRSAQTGNLVNVLQGGQVGGAGQGGMTDGGA